MVTQTKRESKKSIKHCQRGQACLKPCEDWNNECVLGEYSPSMPRFLDKRAQMTKYRREKCEPLVSSFKRINHLMWGKTIVESHSAVKFVVRLYVQLASLSLIVCFPGENLSQYLIPSTEPGSAQVLISVNPPGDEEWFTGLREQSSGVISGPQPWGEWAGELGIKASLGQSAHLQWCMAACEHGGCSIKRIVGEWERARLQSGFGAQTVITPDSVWFGIQWCTRHT